MKKVKIFKIIIVLLLVSSMFSGCMKKQSLSDLSIVEGMSVDEKDGEKSIVLQTLNMQKGGSGTESLSGNITMTTDGKGKSISDAISVATKSLAKDTFFGQNKIIVFGYDSAKNSIDKNLDYLLRSTDSRADVIIAMADKNGEDIIKAKENDALVPAENVLSLIKNGEKNGLGVYITENKILNLYADKTSDIYMTVLKAEDEKVSVSGTAIFSKSNLAAILDEKETLGFLFIKDEIKTALVTSESEKYGKITAEVSSSRTKKTAHYKNGTVTFEVKIKPVIILDEIEKGITVDINTDEAKEIEKIVEKEIEKNCQMAFDKCIENESDALRIGEYLAKGDPKSYKKLSDDWIPVLKKAKLEIKVDCKMKKINETQNRN